jgi:arylsulfatase A-like enzyme
MWRFAGYQVAVPGHRGDVFATGVTEASSDFCGNLVEPDGNAMLAWYVSPFPEDDVRSRAYWHGCMGDELRVDFDEAAVRTAEAWLADAATDRPWLLWLALMFPHPPFAVEEPWFSLHDRAAVPAPIPPTDATGKPGFMTALREAYGWEEIDAALFAEIAATYYGMVSRVDWQLGRIVEAVDRAGALDDTVFIVVTDHGEYLGDFGLVEKWPSGLDPCLTRNPLVVAGPGVREGAVVDALVELVDLLPTVSDLTGACVQHTHFGRSLAPLLADPSGAHRAHAFSEGGFRAADHDLFERAGGVYRAKTDLQHARPELVGTAIALRSPTHTYVYRAYESDELYDRAADPSETTNLIDRPEHTGVAAELRAAVLDWLVDTSDVIPWDADPRFPEIAHGYR